jgi:hypothetical protein
MAECLEGWVVFPLRVQAQVPGVAAVDDQGVATARTSAGRNSDASHPAVRVCPVTNGTTNLLVPSARQANGMIWSLACRSIVVPLSTSSSSWRAARRRCAPLLALNGLRVSEATGADIEHLGLERGHRTLTITRKGGKVVTVPLAPRTARAIDLAIGERTDGPVFLAADGRRLDRHGAGRIVRRAHAAPGSASLSGRTHCGTRSLPPPRARSCI